ncbi:MAG: FecR domain-containing protein [Candidatus Baltobacteraceae bacterium]
MRATALLLATAALALPVTVRADTADKQLQSIKGQVSYQHGAATKALATSASIVLANKDYTITGADSRGAVDLPDSSVVTIGSDTKVQMAFFNQGAIANAKFVIYNGNTRFEVRHPQGSKANYTFVTPTASIAVRGTQGDIGVTPDSLQVNVYEVCDPEMPVIVTTKSGQQFTVRADEAFVGKIVGGILRAQVEQLTQQMIDQIAPDLSNYPMSAQAVADRARGEVTGALSGAASDATGGMVGGSEITQAFGGLFKKKATPAPAPTAAPSATCG